MLRRAVPLLVLKADSHQTVEAQGRRPPTPAFAGQAGGTGAAQDAWSPLAWSAACSVRE